MDSGGVVSSEKAAVELSKSAVLHWLQQLLLGQFAHAHQLSSHLRQKSSCRRVKHPMEAGIAAPSHDGLGPGSSDATNQDGDQQRRRVEHQVAPGALLHLEWAVGLVLDAGAYEVARAHYWVKCFLIV